MISIRLDEVASAIESQEISLKKLQRRKVAQPTDGINDVEKIARQLLIVRPNGCEELNGENQFCAIKVPLV